MEARSMMLKILHWVSARLLCREILREDGLVYLSRYKIYGWMPGDERSYPFSIYLHRFHTPDYDPAPHNHPWEWAKSLILTGGYVEHRLEPLTGLEACFEVRAPAINRISDDTFHVVEELLGTETWTLFIVGPKTGTWGFWVPGRGYVPWRDRLRERGLTPEY